MKRISDYIAMLECLKAEHGDVEVVQGAYNTTLGAVSPAGAPKLVEMAKLKPREQNMRHVLSIDGEDRRTGRKMVYVGR